jgi:ribosomal protein L6P/L9E
MQNNYLNYSKFYIFSNLNNYFIFYNNNNNIIYLKILLKKDYYLSMFKNIIKIINLKFIENLNNNFFYYIKLFNIGLGFKNFVYNNYLYLYLGDANYYKLNFNNNNIHIICKKNQIIFLSKNNIILYNFVNKLIKLKKLNLYKGKGIIPYMNFKFMKLKKGKKKN